MTPAPMPAPAVAPFHDIFRDHAPYVGRVLRNLGVREADLMDALQDVFLVVHRKLPEFRGDSTLKTWMYGICIRVAAAQRRRPHKQREEPLTEGLVAGDLSPHEEAERSQALSRLDGALAKLDSEKRAVFVLYELEELTLAEIAEVTGAPLPTVYSRLKAARNMIQLAFNEPHVRGTPNPRTRPEAP